MHQFLQKDHFKSVKAKHNVSGIHAFDFYLYQKVMNGALAKYKGCLCFKRSNLKKMK